MNRAQLKGKVQTVCGTISPDRLGQTLMHEHLLCDIRTPTMKKSNVKDPEITLQNRHAIDYGRMPHAMQYVMDMKDIAIVERKTMEVVGSVAPKGMIGPGHHIDVDSKGNLYIAQTGSGMQKLVFKGMAPAASR